MPLALGWGEITMRILCALFARALLGLNRSEHGRAAGLRTSMLVSLAACIAMLQVNLLLPLSGRTSDSFVMNDLMRLPLGILSGMGFIGAGAILRRGNLVAGITTAATMWFLTVVGLCFGGGQIGIGIAGTTAALIILVGIKGIEDRMKQDRQGNLLVVVAESGPGDEEICRILYQNGFQISGCQLDVTTAEGLRELNCRVHWRSKPYDADIPEAVRGLNAKPGVLRIAWRPELR